MKDVQQPLPVRSLSARPEHDVRAGFMACNLCKLVPLGLPFGGRFSEKPLKANTSEALLSTTSSMAVEGAPRIWSYAFVKSAK